ncbi:MAG: RNA polymerase subunit sigma [Rhodobacteraceae bacterium]|nr:RNA polymerase subunit sigma [Paracoccaceae bacterium]MAY46476.1 RNA polymerase subunit sigma [Paracoccaceae bacterium]
MQEDEEAVLLAAFANGDHAAAVVLTDRLTPRAFGLALRLLGDRAEAEDITQEAMIRLWRMAPDWEPGTAKVSTWLYRVVTNLCLDHKRRRRGRDGSLDDAPEPADDAPSVADKMQNQARGAALQWALDQLPDRQRLAIVLRHLQDLPNPRIAEVMEISVEAVESLTARGKRTLTQLLAGRKGELGYEDD